MIDPFSFNHRRVLVTGAAGGIGSAMARAFSAHDATLVLADRDGEGLEQVAAEIDGSPELLIYDQANHASVAAMAEAAGPVDVLLNNAGILALGPILEHSPETIEQIVLTNLAGPMVLARAIAKTMIENNGGVIVNTASQLAFAGAAERAAYASTKAGIVQFTRSVAAEWAPQGVRVVALAPGRTLTPLNAAALTTPEQREAALKHIPAGRFGHVDEMAELALFLASERAGYIVGETLVADGGYVVAD